MSQELLSFGTGLFFAAFSPTQNVVVTMFVLQGYGPRSFRIGAGLGAVEGPSGVIGPYGVGIRGEKGCVRENGFADEGTVVTGTGGAPPAVDPPLVGLETVELRLRVFSFLGAAFAYGFGTIAARDVAMIAEDR
jgi:hypothetical protein